MAALKLEIPVPTCAVAIHKQNLLITHMFQIVKANTLGSVGAPVLLLEIANRIFTSCQLVHCATTQFVVDTYNFKKCLFTLKLLPASGHCHA